MRLKFLILLLLAHLVDLSQATVHLSNHIGSWARLRLLFLLANVSSRYYFDLLSVNFLTVILHCHLTLDDRFWGLEDINFDVIVEMGRLLITIRAFDDLRLATSWITCRGSTMIHSGSVLDDNVGVDRHLRLMLFSSCHHGSSRSPVAKQFLPVSSRVGLTIFPL